MFENLSQKLDSVLSSLKGKSMVTKESFNITMNTVKNALIEADVSLEVVKHFIEKIEEKVIGQKVIKRISPSKVIIKIFEDELTRVLGTEKDVEQSEEQASKQPDSKVLLKNLTMSKNPPTVIMMVGLQGCGKTTTSGKLAFMLRRFKKTVVMASLDTYRPAAREQLAILAKQVKAASLPIEEGKSPEEIAKAALGMAQDEGYEVLILDTAGRLHLDEALMEELKRVKQIAKPDELLLVADSLIGQDAVRMAKEFDQALDLTGIVLTRVDADSRGGAALSMRYTTGKPVKFLGSGEQMKDLDPFNPRRVARRILGMGDVVSLVEKAYQFIEEDESDKLSKKAMAGKFDFNDLRAQLSTLKKLGGIGSIMKFIPGINNLNLPGMADDSLIKKHVALIDSMTKKERANPGLAMMNSRKSRIISGSGTTASDFNLLMNQFRQAGKMVKQINKVGIGNLQGQNILDMLSKKK